MLEIENCIILWLNLTFLRDFIDPRIKTSRKIPGKVAWNWEKIFKSGKEAQNRAKQEKEEISDFGYEFWGLLGEKAQTEPGLILYYG